MRVARNSAICDILNKASVPCEPEFFDPNGTLVYAFPIHRKGKPAEQVSLWQQAVNLATVQREWADNAVSNTLYFRPMWKQLEASFDINEFVTKLSGYTFQFHYDAGNDEVVTNDKNYKIEKINGEWKFYKFDPQHEEDDIEPVLSAFAPLIKSLSLLPHTAEGVYKQMPESSITEEEYYQRLQEINWQKLDYSNFNEVKLESEKYCQGDKCEVILPASVLRKELEIINTLPLDTPRFGDHPLEKKLLSNEIVEHFANKTVEDVLVEGE